MNPYIKYHQIRSMDNNKFIHFIRGVKYSAEYEIKLFIHFMSKTTINSDEEYITWVGNNYRLLTGTQRELDLFTKKIIDKHCLCIGLRDTITKSIVTKQTNDHRLSNN